MSETLEVPLFKYAIVSVCKSVLLWESSLWPGFNTLLDWLYFPPERSICRDEEQKKDHDERAEKDGQTELYALRLE